MNWKFKIMVFLSGIFSNLIRFFFLLLLSAIFMIIGIVGENACKDVGVMIFIVYLMAAVLEWVRTYNIAFSQDGVDDVFNMFKEYNINTENGNTEQGLFLDGISFELNTKTRDTAFFIFQEDNGLEYSFDCCFDRRSFKGENITPSICINPIGTSAKNIEDLVGEHFEVKTVDEAQEREDSLYVYEHEPLENYRLRLLEVKNDRIHIMCIGTAIIDGYAQPYKTAPFELDCWLPIITCKEDWEKFEV
ncbi:MAG: hypothetical protein K2N51_18495 [Lachnospiraceae bacterium]|nr:hypothetical protein [Lachnospiraceae bacterium]